MASEQHKTPNTDFPHRLFLDRSSIKPRVAADIDHEESRSEAALLFLETHKRADDVSVQGVSCIEKLDDTGQVLGRVWVRSSVEVETVE